MSTFEEENASPGTKSRSLDEPLAQQLHRCKTTNAVYATLNTKLRAYQSYRIGDNRLYLSLTDASRYIQGMCEKSVEGQDALRESGVLNSLLEAFVSFYAKHLEGHVNPLNTERLLKCWSNLCTALWEAVDNPVNKKNQDSVMKKLIDKNDLKLIQFVLISSKSVEKSTERYVISLVQFFKALVFENVELKKLILATEYFIPSLAEGLRIRLQLSHRDLLMWKSIDLMGWLLSMLVGQDATINEDEDISGVSSEKSSSNFEQVLADLVAPILLFMEKDRLTENPQSIGIIMMCVSMLGINLDIVQRFIRGKGEMILAQIFVSQQTDGVVNAAKLAFQVLNIQKKRMRGRDFIENNQMEDIDAISMTSKPYNISIVPSGPKDNIDTQYTRSIPVEPKPKTPLQIVPNYALKGCENARQWVETCPINFSHDRGSKDSSDSSPLPSPPPPSEVETSISHYRTPSVFSFCAPPKFKTDCCCCENCKTDPSKKPVTCPVFYEPDNGPLKNWTGITGFHPPLRKISSSRSVPPTSCRNEFEFAPPMKRERKSVERFQHMACEMRDFEISEDEEENRSFISVKIPRKRVTSSRIQDGCEQKDIIGEDKNIEDEFSRIISDLRPCNIMETDDHVVVFCSSVPSKSEKKSDNSTQQGINEFKSHSTKVAARSKDQGIFGRLFRWLFQ